MKPTLFTLLLFLMIGSSHAFTPEEAKATRLTDVAVLPSEYRVAVVAAAAYLKSKGEEPSEFYVSDISLKAKIIILPLWHESAFKLKEPVLGNPGGKCRNLEYDTASMSIVGELFWQ